MQKITANTRPVDIEVLKPFSKYLMYKCVLADRPAVEMTFQEMHQNQPTWDVGSMIRGMEHLCEIAENQQVMYDVYQPEECEDDSGKADVKIFFLPAKEQSSDKPFIILIAGGAYTCVCSIVESFPTAALLNEMGYNTFVLSYRVLQNPLLPKPQEDIAAALHMIFKNKKKFGIRNENYIVNGYSAGASATVIWGTERNGWAKYGLPAPKALWPIYPFISSEYMYEESKDWFLKMMFGTDYNMITVKSFNIPESFTDKYPPCYIVHAKDDPDVPCRNSIELKKLLDEHHISSELELIKSGGHGWGDGSGTEAAGWPERAAMFVEQLK